MSYTHQMLPGESILIFTAQSDFNIAKELGSTTAKLFDLLNAADSPMVYILDLSALPPVSMEEIMSTANTLTRGANPVYHHPNMGRIMAVTPNPVLQIAYKGLSHEVFGNLEVTVFNTLADALAQARSG